MDIQSINNDINNPVISSVNNDVTKLKEVSTTEKISELLTNSVSISIDSNNIDKRSNLSSSISNHLENMAKIGSVSTSLNQQINTIDKIQDKVANLSQGTSTQEEVQPDVAEFISKYNASVGSINDKMSKLSDLEGDSTTYFDGSAGAMPLSIDMINNEMSTKRTELKSTLSKVSELNETFKSKAQSVITEEVQKVQEASPFKEINFGKESADFSSTNMTNVIGSIASSQANAMQTQSVRLLS